MGFEDWHKSNGWRKYNHAHIIDLCGMQPYALEEEYSMGQVRRSHTPAKKNERLEARITPAQKRLIERAAHLRGTSVTEFVVVSAQQAATEIINNFEMLTLSGEAREAFVSAVLNPPEPTKAAREAARDYKRHKAL